MASFTDGGRPGRDPDLPPKNAIVNMELQTLGGGFGEGQEKTEKCEENRTEKIQGTKHHPIYRWSIKCTKLLHR